MLKIILTISGLLAIVYCASDMNKEVFFDESNEPNCPSHCHRVYHPVCGQTNDGATQMFASSCSMWMENCNKPENEVYYETSPEICPDSGDW
ncbi:enhancer of split M1 protein-like [Sitodiplosis mosellana]|uniref:enhancer of split M1 protein-like n=1 Tax=Sitodiplosis mosellana TaxID=263140 RepID=UPI002444CB4B|nr:enhancer of split M1 protein-like [Sitodiplosis mosellana]